jgi:hypothetical protein
MPIDDPLPTEEFEVQTAAGLRYVRPVDVGIRHHRGSGGPICDYHGNTSSPGKMMDEIAQGLADAGWTEIHRFDATGVQMVGFPAPVYTPQQPGEIIIPVIVDTPLEPAGYGLCFTALGTEDYMTGELHEVRFLFFDPLREIPGTGCHWVPMGATTLESLGNLAGAMNGTFGVEVTPRFSGTDQTNVLVGQEFLDYRVSAADSVHGYPYIFCRASSAAVGFPAVLENQGYVMQSWSGNLVVSLQCQAGLPGQVVMKLGQYFSGSSVAASGASPLDMTQWVGYAAENTFWDIVAISDQFFWIPSGAAVTGGNSESVASDMLKFPHAPKCELGAYTFARTLDDDHLSWYAFGRNLVSYAGSAKNGRMIWFEGLRNDPGGVPTRNMSNQALLHNAWVYLNNSSDAAGVDPRICSKIYDLFILLDAAASGQPFADYLIHEGDRYRCIGTQNGIFGNCSASMWLDVTATGTNSASGLYPLTLKVGG